MNYIDCKSIAEEIKGRTKEKLSRLKKKPQLAVSTDYFADKSDALYLNGIIKDASEMGIHVGGSANTADGILYLGKSWSERRRLPADVDGVSADSKKLMSVVSATMLLLDRTVDISGKSALVIGRGRVGRQIARELLRRDVTVSIVHTRTSKETLDILSGNADIIINTGASGESFNASNCVVAVDLSGGENKWLNAPASMRLTSRKDGIGCITRAILLDRLVDNCADAEKGTGK